MIGKMQMETVRAKTSRCLDPALELDARRHRHVKPLKQTTYYIANDHLVGVWRLLCYVHMSRYSRVGDLKDSLDSTPANFHTKPDVGAGTQAILRRHITRTCIQRRRLSCEV